LWTAVYIIKIENTNTRIAQSFRNSLDQKTTRNTAWYTVTPLLKYFYCRYCEIIYYYLLHVPLYMYNETIDP